MRTDVLGCLAVGAIDVPLDLGGFDAPLATPAELDRPKLTAPYQCIRLCQRGGEHLRDLFEHQEAAVRHLAHGGPVCHPLARMCVSGRACCGTRSKRASLRD